MWDISVQWILVVVKEIARGGGVVAMWIGTNCSQGLEEWMLHKSESVDLL
jgi:hypothetical protein